MIKRRVGKKTPWFLILSIILISLALIEALARFANLNVPFSSCPLEPYLMTGITKLPRDYGYEEKGGVYIYENSEEIESIADRASFMINDRSKLTNNVPSQGKPLRVFVLGGSVAYGFGASNSEKRWFVVLEKMLSAGLHRPVRLISAALPGAVSTQERIALELMVLPRKPDAVLILDGWNDAAVGMSGTRPGDPYNLGVLYEQQYSPLFGIRRFLSQHSAAIRLFLNRLFQGATEGARREILKSAAARSRYTESIASVYLDNISSMLSRCRDAQIPCSVFLQPAKVVTQLALEPKLSLNTTNSLIALAYESIYRKFSSFKKGAFHDLSHAFDSKEKLSWYTDVVHFNDQGHAEIAHAMYPIVLKLLK